MILKIIWAAKFIFELVFMKLYWKIGFFKLAKKKKVALIYSVGLVNLNGVLKKDERTSAPVIKSSETLYPLLGNPWSVSSWAPQVSWM